MKPKAGEQIIDPSFVNQKEVERYCFKGLCEALSLYPTVYFTSTLFMAIEELNPIL